MSDKLEQNNKQIEFLQDTVARECQEREDLTRELAKARGMLQAGDSTGRALHSAKPSKHDKLARLDRLNHDVARQSNRRNSSGPAQPGVARRTGRSKRAQAGGTKLPALSTERGNRKPTLRAEQRVLGEVRT